MKILLSSEVFWNAFSAISTTVCAITAIFISIFTHIKANKKGVNIICDWNTELYDAMPDKKYGEVDFLEKVKARVDLIVNVVNKGSVPVAIYDYGMAVKNKNETLCVYSSLKNGKKLESLSLIVGESLDFIVDYHKIFNFKEEHGTEDSEVFIYCKTSYGKKFSKPLKRIDVDNVDFEMTITEKKDIS